MNLIPFGELLFFKKSIAYEIIKHALGIKTKVMIDSIPENARPRAILISRIYVCGFSNGAYLTYELACLLNDKIAAGTGITKSILNASGNEQLQLAVSGVTSAEVYGFNLSFVPSTINYTVSVQSVGGANKYFILGTQQKTLELLEGNTYVFNYPSAHPFKFSTTSDGSHGGGSEYTTGVTHNSSTKVTIVVASGAPTLYYYCSSHSGMGGQANTPVPANNTLQVITTNQGADNITNTQYNSFTDTLLSASGFTFSIDGTTGNLIATI